MEEDPCDLVIAKNSVTPAEKITLHPRNFHRGRYDFKLLAAVTPELASFVAHNAYGEALGITTVKAAVETPAIRVARDAVVEVVRGYVLRVAALVRKSDPKAEALSQRLLAPIVNWREVLTKAGAAADPAAPADPGVSTPT